MKASCRVRPTSLRASALGLAASLLLLAPGSARSGIPGFPLDHYQGYPISAATAIDGPIVQIADQFGTQTTDLDRSSWFLVPVDKNDEGILDPFSHLTCYQIVDGAAGPPVVSTNQFGVQPLTLGPPSFLCTPTEKLIAPGPVLLDHYKCYEASGAPISVGVALQDQFQARSTILLDPKFFCTPADKNGEGIIDPITHFTHTARALHPNPVRRVMTARPASQRAPVCSGPAASPCGRAA